MNTQCTGNWKPHEIQQLNGQADRIMLPAKLQILTKSWTGRWTEQWSRVGAIPNITYIPEKDRVLMMVSVGVPHQAVILASDDRGATWSEPTYVHTDPSGKSDTGMGVGLAYVEDGRVLLWTMDLTKLGIDAKWMRWSSEDCGRTWTQGAAVPLERGFPWDQPTVERDPQTGRVTKTWETAYIEDHSRPIWSQSYLRHSDDAGRTWSEFVEIPQWSATNEVRIVRAANGDLVAALRTDMPDKFIERDPQTGKETKALDVYEGLGVSISRDEGRTWSAVE